MDFFKAQDQARKATRKLIVLYILAVIGLVFTLYAAVRLVFGFVLYMGPFWNPELFMWVSAFTLLIIFAGTTGRIIQLRRGGAAVAEMIGGRLVNPSTKEPKERQLINVVEEMSIASGIPAPLVYILDHEQSINAFAAGYGTRDAAVGVTAGTLEHLNRDELQGVIAHEFSHIFNGDMRLNIRLIGILNGILLIHLMGMIFLRMTYYTNLRSRNSDAGKAILVIIILGVALVVIGYIGMLFARMIQSAVSRQREYLADAAAVQYTRNPEGIAGALMKISGTYIKPTINDPHAMEVGHMFFSNGFKTALDGLFATHPPIKKRIEAIGVVPVQKKRRMQDGPEKKSKKEALADSGPGGLFRPEIIIAAIGSMTSNDLDSARQLLDRLPEAIRDAAHNPLEAEALIYSLLLSDHERTRGIQLGHIRKNEGPEMDRAMWHLSPYIKYIKPEWHLSVVDIAIPSLKMMSKEQYGKFRENMETLIKADKVVTVFEFALEKVIVHNLDSHFDQKPEPAIMHKSLNEVSDEVSILLSALSYASDGNPMDSWNKALEALAGQLPEKMEIKEESECIIAGMNKALDALAQSTHEIKRLFLLAAVHAVSADGKLNIRELELLRAMSAAIDCPMPVSGMG